MGSFAGDLHARSQSLNGSFLELPPHTYSSDSGLNIGNEL